MTDTNPIDHNPQKPSVQSQNDGRGRWRMPFSRLFTVVAAVTLVACASTGGIPAAEQQLRQRATERWQALIKGEFSRAYLYSTPSFKAVVTPDAYRNRFGSAVTWTAAEVVLVSCSEVTTCTVTMSIDFKPLIARAKLPSVSTRVEETWLFEQEQWWFFQKI